MHLFYPSHDLALANGVKHFNPPFAARRLEEDLAPLSEIWEKYGAGNPFPMPWGWDYDTRAFIHKEYGIKLKDLPSDEDLHQLRELSSRKTTIEILKRLKSSLPQEFSAIFLPLFFDNIESLKEFESFGNGAFVLKSPWSSSGRGLSRSDVWPKETLLKHGEATIKRQGGVIVEPWYEKTQDLAELFYVGKEEVTFVGYSIFNNDENGTYRYGELMSNDLMSASLPQICDDTRDLLIEILKDIFSPLMHKSWVVGFVGIDMMLLEDSETLLHPCVEMNVRCTMGVVARLFFDQTFGADSDEIGEFYISPAFDYEKLSKMDSDFRELYKSRYLRLTEINPETKFMAYAIMS